MFTKAQVLSTDFIIATGFFILSIVVLYYFWNYSYVQLEEVRRANEISNAAYVISSIWFREGVPEYWNTSNVIEIGLQNNHRFNQTKLDYLNDLGYYNVKEMLGYPIYDFYLRIYDMQNNTFFDFGEIPTEDVKNIEKIERIGIMNSTVVYVETLVWR